MYMELRKAETKGGKYSIAMQAHVGDTSVFDIVHKTNSEITARNCNIPADKVNQRFDAIIADTKKYDKINYIEI